MNTVLFRPARAGSASMTLTFIAATACIVVSAFGSPAFLIVVAFVPALIAAAVDCSAQRLPDRLVLLTACPALAAVVAAGNDRATVLGSAVLGTAAMTAPLLALHLVAPATIGFGDVKLAAALGSVVGLESPPLALPALAIASGLTLLVALVRRRPALPFGPGLVAGTAIAIAATRFGLEMSR